MASEQFDIWLDVGREGRAFTYVDQSLLGVGLGDLVQVKLRGRSMNGLVIAKRDVSSSLKVDELAGIEALVQKGAVDPSWRDWIDEIAERCHTSSFRMLKAAFPTGWLGQLKSNQKPKSFWWVYIERTCPEQHKLTKRQLELEAFLLSKGGSALQRDIYAMGFSLTVLNGLISKGRATRKKKDLGTFVLNQNESKTMNKKSIENHQRKQLTSEQQLALKTFEDLRPGKALLLWGVTGSGKTEVYLQIVEKELKTGRHCLVLAPEIGLIPQLVDRFRARFGSQVHEYHSGCSQREKVQLWKKVLSNELPLVLIGTRSAIFLPLSPLGVIILDEEHDTSYKQESPMPCYHARDLALSKAVKTGAKVVLGSATPSLVTWKNLAPRGSIALARLQRRISNKPLPKVHLVDMRDEFAQGHRKLLSRYLIEQISSLPMKGEQAVILVPRRGYSTFLSCRSCGEVVECPHCDVALTVHQNSSASRWLRCHWCDFRTSLGSNCESCGSSAFKPFGAGTQRVMDCLETELPEVKFLRFDRDTTGGRDGHRKLLQKFAEGEADVLVGTQMLSKGIDLPRVTLAVLLAADGLLYRPDLFAAEQSLQLFLQLAGRAGRGEKVGKVVAQTYCPDNPVLKHLIDDSYEDFLESELKLRKEANLIPFSRACLLRLAGESATITATTAAALAERIKPLCKLNGWILVGPAPALVARVAGKSRWQLLLHGPLNSPLPFPAGEGLWDSLPKGVTLSVDPDPLQL